MLDVSPKQTTVHKKPYHLLGRGPTSNATVPTVPLVFVPRFAVHGGQGPAGTTGRPMVAGPHDVWLEHLDHTSTEAVRTCENLFVNSMLDPSFQGLVPLMPRAMGLLQDKVAPDAPITGGLGRLR